MVTPDAGPLAAHGLVLAHGARTVVDGLDLAITAGTVTALVGPNGSGKSTLLHALSRVLAPQAGVVRLDGRPLAEQRTADVARRLALLPQSAVAPAGATVRELVEQGRHPHRGALDALRRRGPDPVVEQALELAGVAGFARRRVERLSGGERQRVWIALALAQETELLLLDEPTTYLDVRHQLDLMRLVERLRDEHGKTVVMVLHDLNQAARHADRVVALRDGRVVADGAPADVVTPAVLREVFDVDATVLTDPASGRPVFLPQ